MRTLRASLLFVLIGVFASAASADPSIRIAASAKAADGKIVVVGQADAAPTGPITVGRLNPDGTMDATFGAGGWVDFTPPMNVYSEFRATAIAASPGDGKIVVATRLDGLLALVRLDSTGAPDPTLMGSGMLTAPQSGGFNAKAVVVDGMGDMLVVGSFGTVGTSGGVQSAAFGYTANGAPNGAAMPQFSSGDNELVTAVLAPNGVVYAAGYARATAGAEKGFLVAAFHMDTSADTAFAGTGSLSVDLNAGWDDEATAIGVNAWGDVYVAGRNGYIHPSGSDMSSVQALRVSPDGSYYAFTPLGIAINNPTSSPDYYDVGATPRSIDAVPGTSDVLIGVRAVGRTGLAFFSMVRFNGSFSSPQATGPLTPGDDLLAGAYTDGMRYVAVGTRESATGAAALRIRYFFDDLSVDQEWPDSAPDETPNAFDFGLASSPDPAVMITSSTVVRIAGINVPTSISIANGEYMIEGGSFTSAAGVVTNGQRVWVRTLSASTPDTTTTATLTVGTVQGTFQVLTWGYPETSIDKRPPNPGNGSASFTYWVSNANSSPLTFECRLDGAAFATCPNAGITYNNLPAGSHTFEVRGIDSWGADPTPASYTWTVQVPPVATITSSPPALSTSPDASFAFTADQAGATFSCAIDTGAFASCTSPRTYSLLDGSHAFYVRASNAFGTGPTVQYAWVIDHTPPQISLSANISGASATFTWSSDDPAAAYACSLDDAAFAACTSPLALTDLPQGSHAFRVRATDSAGNANTRSYIWFIDSIAPDTSIDSGPSGTVRSLGAQFSFSATETSTFECRIDAGPWVACTSPHTVTGIADGTHTFDVRARDATGNVDATPASRTWIQDTTAPDTVIVTHPFATTSLSTATFTLASNESGVTYECALDGAPWSACQASGVAFSGLAAGNHSFQARATDAAGNPDFTPAGFGWTIDPSYGPDTSITSAPAAAVNSTGATITFTSDKQNVTFECTFNGGRSACTSPWTASGLADGTYTFTVAATDSEGNTDRSPASVTWTVDTSVPDTTITSGASGTMRTSSATFTFTATDPAAAFDCSLDAAAFAACTSGITYNALAEGMHMFEVRARDAAGNVDPSPASATWSVDTTVPNTTITSAPSAITTSTTATFAFSADEGGVFMCSLDGAAPSACSSPVTYAALSSATHAFSVYAIDPAGNADPSAATWSWIVDAVPPETSIAWGPSGSVSSTTATFTFGASESATFECRLDGAAFTACTSPQGYAGLANGSHTFQVRSTDAAGNVDATPASAAWTVDTVAPDTTITGGPSGNNNPNTATFTFTSTEAGATFQCSLDNAAFAACASPVTFGNLARGSHTFQVRAIDGAGNVDVTPATRTWKSN